MDVRIGAKTPDGKQRRAIIVGGSMGGLFAALALSQRGWHVDVFERNATPLAGRGAGIATHDRLNAALAAVGVAAEDPVGITIQTRCLYDRAGALQRTVAYPQLNTSWDSLLQMLRAAVPNARYHLGRTVTQVATEGDHAIATFGDGTTAVADVIVAADGIRSVARAGVAPEAEPVYAGYVAWRGLVEETALSPDAHAALMPCFAFCLPPGEQMLGYPVAGADADLTPGRRRYNFVWYRPAVGDALERLLTDETGHRHAVSVPPPLVAKSVIADMQAAAARTLAPAFGEAVAATAMPFFQPIYDLAVPRMVAGRVVLLGDAAFVARPHVGGGVTKAAEDALALAANLDGPDLDAGLAAFNRARCSIGRRIVQQGRDLGAVLDQGHAAPHGQIDVLRDTASLAFLD